jgi:hypothetical protein
MVIATALVLGIAAGFLLRREDVSSIRWGWLGVAVAVAVLFTTALVLACALHVLPYDLPVQNWDVLMILMGIYQAAGVLLALLCFPWAPFRSRLKAMVGALAGALIVGWRIYGGGDLVLLPSWQEHVCNFAKGGGFAAVAVSAGAILKWGFGRVLFVRS